jgi:hypothetical protein
LGEAFPVRKLARLHSELAEGEKLPEFRTLRWNSRPGLVEVSLEARWKSLAAEIAKHLEANEAASGTAQANDKLMNEIGKLLAEPPARRKEFSAQTTALAVTDDATPETRQERLIKLNSQFDELDKWLVEWEQRLTVAVERLDKEFQTPELPSIGQPSTRDMALKAAPLVLRNGLQTIQLRRDLGVARDDRQLVAESLGLHRPIW